jgi:hypothetical protein
MTFSRRNVNFSSGRLDSVIKARQKSNCYWHDLYFIGHDGSDG